MGILLTKLEIEKTPISLYNISEAITYIDYLLDLRIAQILNLIILKWLKDKTFYKL